MVVIHSARKSFLPDVTLLVRVLTVGNFGSTELGRKGLLDIVYRKKSFRRTKQKQVSTKAFLCCIFSVPVRKQPFRAALKNNIITS